LNGGGGDELFFGYPTYSATAFASWNRFVPVGFLRMLQTFSKFVPTSHKKLSANYKIRKFLEGFGLNRNQAHYWWRTIITENEKSSLLPRESLVRDSYWAYESAYKEYSGNDWLEKYSYADLMVWWTSMGLYQADCMSMANSLELRVPMMDHEFVELAYQIPRREKYRYSATKPLLKQLGKRLLPSELLKLKKSGFHIPLAEWFCSSLRDFVLDKLSDRRVENLGFLNPKGVKSILEEHFSRKADNSFKINNLLVLVEWYHQFIHGDQNEVRSVNRLQAS